MKLKQILLTSGLLLNVINGHANCQDSMVFGANQKIYWVRQSFDTGVIYRKLTVPISAASPNEALRAGEFLISQYVQALGRWNSGYKAVIVEGENLRLQTYVVSKSYSMAIMIKRDQMTVTAGDPQSALLIGDALLSTRIEQLGGEPTGYKAELVK